jgi:hypothetical protein
MNGKRLILKLSENPQANENFICVLKSEARKYNFHGGMETGDFVSSLGLPSYSGSSKFWQCSLVISDTTRKQFLLELLHATEIKTGIRAQFKLEDVDCID